MDTNASKEILKYYYPYDKAIRLNIDKINRKITVIPRTDYAPVADIPITFFIRSKKQLNQVLSSQSLFPK